MEGSELAGLSPGLALALNLSVGIPGSPFVAALPRVALNMYLSPVSVKPSEFLARIKDGREALIAKTECNPFELKQGNPAPLDVGVVLPGPFSASNIELLQMAIARISGTDPSGETTFYLYMKGDTTLSPEEEKCLAQRVLAQSVPWRLPIKGKTADKADSPGGSGDGGGNDRRQLRRRGQTEGGKQSSPTFSPASPPSTDAAGTAGEASVFASSLSSSLSAYVSSSLRSLSEHSSVASASTSSSSVSSSSVSSSSSSSSSTSSTFSSPTPPRVQSAHPAEAPAFKFNGMDFFSADAKISSESNTTSNATATQRLTFAVNMTMPFVIHGDLPRVAFDFHMGSHDDRRVMAHIETRPIHIDWMSNDARKDPLVVLIDVQLGNITYIVDQLSTAKDLDALGLAVTGSPDINLLSTVHEGFTVNITDDVGQTTVDTIKNHLHGGNDAGGAGGTAAGASAEPVSIDINVTSDHTHLGVHAGLRVPEPPLPFYLRVGNLSCEIVLPKSPSTKIRLALPSFEMLQGTPCDIVATVDVADTSQGVGLREFVSDLAAGRDVPLRIEDGEIERQGFFQFRKDDNGKVQIEFVSLSELIPKGGGGGGASLNGTNITEAPMLSVQSVQLASIASSGAAVDLSCLLAGDCPFAKAHPSRLDVGLLVNGSFQVRAIGHSQVVNNMKCDMLRVPRTCFLIRMLARRIILCTYYSFGNGLQ